MLKVTIHSVGTGICAMAEKEDTGLTVTFEDGTVRDVFLSWKSFRQLCAMKAPKAAKPKIEPMLYAPPNGPTLATP